MASPARPDARTAWGFLHLAPTPGAHRVGVRAGISVLVPLLGVLVVERPEWALYATFGAFTSLYGRNHVHLSRAVMQLSAGAALTASVAVGVLVGSLEQRAWAAVAVGAVVAALGSVLASVQDWHPPGPLFLVFGFGAVASVPHEVGDVVAAAGVAAASAAFSVVVGNVGAVLRGQRSPHRRRARGRLGPAWTVQPLRQAAAVVAAGGIATALGIGHPYWAMLAASAPLTVRGVGHQLVRAAHRVVGTLLGLVSSAALLALHLDPVPTVLVVVVLQVVTEMVVGRNYGVAMVTITPMALLMGQLAAPRPAGELLLDRGVETVVGAAVAVLVVLAGLRLRGRRPRAVDAE